MTRDVHTLARRAGNQGDRRSTRTASTASFEDMADEFARTGDATKHLGGALRRARAGVLPDREARRTSARCRGRTASRSRASRSRWRTRARGGLDRSHSSELGSVGSQAWGDLSPSSGPGPGGIRLLVAPRFPADCPMRACTSRTRASPQRQPSPASSSTRRWSDEGRGRRTHRRRRQRRTGGVVDWTASQITG